MTAFTIDVFRPFGTPHSIHLEAPPQREQIMAVVTASAYRQAAFEAAEFLVDWLKTKAPFWKLESDGAEESWVAARESDDAAAGRWGKG